MFRILSKFFLKMGINAYNVTTKERMSSMNDLKEIKPIQVISDGGAYCDPVTGVCTILGQEVEKDLLIEDNETDQKENEENK